MHSTNTDQRWLLPVATSAGCRRFATAIAVALFALCCWSPATGRAADATDWSGGGARPSGDLNLRCSAGKYVVGLNAHDNGTFTNLSAWCVDVDEQDRWVNIPHQGIEYGQEDSAGPPVRAMCARDQFVTGFRFWTNAYGVPLAMAVDLQCTNPATGAVTTAQIGDTKRVVENEWPWRTCRKDSIAVQIEAQGYHGQLASMRLQCDAVPGQAAAQQRAAQLARMQNRAAGQTQTHRLGGPFASRAGQSVDAKAAPLLGGAAPAAGRRYEPPTNSDGSAVLACGDLADRACQQRNADAFCFASGAGTAGDFSASAGHASARSPSGEECNGDCNAFDVIVCNP